MPVVFLFPVHPLVYRSPFSGPFFFYHHHNHNNINITSQSAYIPVSGYILMSPIFFDILNTPTAYPPQRRALLA